ncbi:MAG: aldo/keto reductase, partial [Verrucomicrobiota bacterium]
SEDLFVATKVGRNNYPGPYSPKTLREHIEAGRARLGVEAVDLVQLHCIPTEVMADGEIFEWLRDLKQSGIIKNFGASVESMEEALLVLDQPGLTSLQIIFNVFRQKPISALFDAAKEKGVGIVVRLPLASGLLSGKFTNASTFDETDHRNYNRDGACFNVGETFAGLPFSQGVELADRVKSIVPAELNMAEFAQRWILDHDAVSTVITGATRPEQVLSNIAASSMKPLSEELHQQLETLYQNEVHAHIRGPY